jgi:hypothetical protein
MMAVARHGMCHACRHIYFSRILRPSPCQFRCAAPFSSIGRRSWCTSCCYARVFCTYLDVCEMIVFNTAQDTRQQVPTGQHIWHLPGLWCTRYCVASLWVALISPRFPKTLREQTIVLWAFAALSGGLPVLYLRCADQYVPADRRTASRAAGGTHLCSTTRPCIPSLGVLRHLLLACPVCIRPDLLVRHSWVRLPLAIVGLLSIFLFTQHTMRGRIP